jgi:hypothetical protein
MRILYSLDGKWVVGIELENACCKELLDAWCKTGAIGLGSPEYPNDSTQISIRHWRCYPEGASADLLKISFCPFCGTEIPDAVLR